MTCWAGTPSSFEARLLKPLPTYALEQFRSRFLYTLTSPFDGVKSARVLFQVAYETEIGAVLTKMIPQPASVPESVVCERRHFGDIDVDMQSQSYLVGPALSELEQVPNMPAPYMDLLRRYVMTDYPRYRVSALAASLCLATFLLVP